MSVSRDFIDSYSPEARNLRNPESRNRNRRRGPETWKAAAVPTRGYCGAITLVFGFQIAEDLLKALISLREAGRLLLLLGQEVFQGLVQADGLVDLGARARPIGAEPDQFLHVRVGRHHPPGPIDERQIGGIGGAGHGAGDRFEDVDGRIATALGDRALHHDVAVQDTAYRI